MKLKRDLLDFSLIYTPCLRSRARWNRRSFHNVPMVSNNNRFSFIRPFMISSTCSFCQEILAHPPFIAFACGHGFHKSCVLANIPGESRVHIPTPIEIQGSSFSESSRLKAQALQVSKAVSRKPLIHTKFIPFLDPGETETFTDSKLPPLWICHAQSARPITYLCFG